MSTSSCLQPPVVAFYDKSDGTYIACGGNWTRATPEDLAKMHTGRDRNSHELHVGVYVSRRPNGLVRLGFDLWKLDVNLRPDVIERLENRWRREVATFSKSMQRSVGRRGHFSKSFARFEVPPEHLETWKSELGFILADPASFERLERRTSNA